jgi:transcriptional regulator with XRE-family HTH domain
MGGRGSGKPYDAARRRLLAGLRAEGLTYAEIGRRLGVSRQGVWELLQDAAPEVKALVVRCRACGRAVAPVRPWANPRRDALCLDCLGRPGVTLGQRLLTCRLAAGLTQAELAARAGIGRNTLSAFERGERRPGRRVLRRLAKVLGPGVLSEGR